MLARERVEHFVVVIEILRSERHANCLDGLAHLAGPQVGDGRYAFDADLLLCQPLDVGEQALLTRLGQRDRNTFAPGSADASDSVDIALGG